MHTSPRLFLSVFAAALLLPALGHAQDAPSPQPTYTPDPFIAQGALHCTDLSWIRPATCDHINKSIADNPDAPIRLYDRQGLEYDFKPGTPWVVIHYLLNPTPATATAWLNYLKAIAYRAEYAAVLMAKTEEVEGPYKGLYASEHPSTASSYANQSPQVAIVTPSVHMTKHGIRLDPFKTVRMYVFYSSDCAWCHKLAPQLAVLHRAHPKLLISMLQLNDDAAGLKEFHRVSQVPTFALDQSVPPAEYKKMMSMLGQGTPVIWLQKQGSKTTTVIPGFQNYDQLVAEVKEVGQ